MPAPSENDRATHAARFIVMLDDAFRRYGAREGLPPRHRFVHRFRIGDGSLQDLDAAPDQTLPVVCSDQVMRHVDEAGEPLPSSNSQPSCMLWLLHCSACSPGRPCWRSAPGPAGSGR